MSHSLATRLRRRSAHCSWTKRPAGAYISRPLAAPPSWNPLDSKYNPRGGSRWPQTYNRLRARPTGAAFASRRIVSPCGIDRRSRHPTRTSHSRRRPAVDGHRHGRCSRPRRKSHHLGTAACRLSARRFGHRARHRLWPSRPLGRDGGDRRRDPMDHVHFRSYVTLLPAMFVGRRCASVVCDALILGIRGRHLAEAILDRVAWIRSCRHHHQLGMRDTISPFALVDFHRGLLAQRLVDGDMGAIRRTCLSSYRFARDDAKPCPTAGARPILRGLNSPHDCDVD
ncbi:hypothetical protein pclt_cds_733 [Pandoravirus celtis]|uniref:Uncharacterized protein n=1 Tax=Pandoravirus celtis TaxID=2568002 RepID=A0A4D6EJF7_9VIRU|nr:hypothetical protein pclt_cds_733 [Pandoravirus celtis]